MQARRNAMRGWGEVISYPDLTLFDAEIWVEIRGSTEEPELARACLLTACMSYFHRSDFYMTQLYIPKIFLDKVVLY